MHWVFYKLQRPVVTKGLIAEWEKQDGVILAFPHEDTDWAYCLEEVRDCLVSIAINITHYEKVYLLCRDEDEARSYFPWIENITYIVSDFNDTWMRDCNVLSCQKDGIIEYKGFEFTGWGGKFQADLDNKIKDTLAQRGVYPAQTYEKIDYILEGGAVESDGRGTLLTTSSCLLNANRNEKHDKKSVEAVLKKELYAQNVLWLDDGHLLGDDTDGHIDTLARFCDAKTIAHVGLPPEDDQHYEAISLMIESLKGFRDINGEVYTLVALPFVPAIFDDGHRLPATYANFLIINGAVLVPTYGVQSDALALDILEKTFPDRNIIDVDCQVLIKEHGSLHCMTMQLPML